LRGLEEISKFLSHFNYFILFYFIAIIYGVCLVYIDENKLVCVVRKTKKKTKHSGVTNFDTHLHRSNELLTKYYSGISPVEFGKQ